MEGQKPAQQYLAPNDVIAAMSAHARRNIREMTLGQSFALALLAGAFIAFGALFSVLLSSGIENDGLALLLQGVGFSTGFFMVILSSAVLFTEVNVIVPAHILEWSRREHCTRIAVFWLVAALGNVLGALCVGWLISGVQSYPEATMDVLRHVVEKKMAYGREGTATAWFAAVGSGVMGNWLVGMAAFFATMGRTIAGKFIPVLLAVTLFVAANFQHSPANMGYFSLYFPMSGEADWAGAALWNLIPAALGNMLGAILFVAVPFWYALSPQKRA